jgi:rhodanese-related sulfurtransferase
MEKRIFKYKVYSILANMVKAMANPHRLEILDLLGQSDRTVEEISGETDMSVANASQHLQVLKASNLVEIKREGNFIRYRLANKNVYELWYNLRNFGFERLSEIEKLIKDFREKKNVLEAMSIDELVKKAKSKNVVVIDVRPEQEYRTGHIINAISIPIDQLAKKIKSLSKDKEYIAYCRGPLCVFADDAVNLLTKKGFKAKRLNEGFPDWKLKGLPVEELI